MIKRWTTKLSQDLPSLDITDILADSIKSSFIKRRQFAAEYSQSCYLTMLREEQAIGSYINIEGLSSPIINEENRKFTVQLIQALHQVKNYKIDTLYLAISIADRYLVNLVIRFEDKPVDFSALAVASLFVAAKIE